VATTAPDTKNLIGSFRDLGIIGTNRYLTGRLTRLAGPLSPITYMRTKNYDEPYQDYDQIGRLVLLRPLTLHLWRSGVPHIYVARSTRLPPMETMALVPGHISLTHAAGILAEAKSLEDVREAFGWKAYDEALRDTRRRIQTLVKEMNAVEEHAGPFRRCFQSSDDRLADWARGQMQSI
jgi:hypothetical protein